MTPHNDRSDTLRQRRHNELRALLHSHGLYHSFRLPDGTILHGANSIETLESRWGSFPIPDSLTGMRVLDVGPWDGFFTFAAEARGANVVAVDYVDLDSFRTLAREFRSKATYVRRDLYEITPAEFGTFDIVLCLGVLYHVKHPLLALEHMCAVTADRCIIETFTVDADSYARNPPDHAGEIPYLELYEYDELGGQLDNWCGPSVDAVCSLCRQAGFAQARVFALREKVASVVAYRKWQDLPPVTGPRSEIIGLNCHAHRGRTFVSAKEQYLQCWCAWTGDQPSIGSVYPEIDGFGVAPLAVSVQEAGLLVSVRLPPGLESGRHTIRVRIGNSDWSEDSPFWLDLPPSQSPLSVTNIQDGRSWDVGVVHWENGGWATVWIAGLTPESDAGCTTIWVDEIPHQPHAVVPQHGQVNFALRPLIGPGSHTLRVESREQSTAPMSFLVHGAPPAIRGLELLHRP